MIQMDSKWNILTEKYKNLEQSNRKNIKLMRRFVEKRRKIKAIF